MRRWRKEARKDVFEGFLRQKGEKAAILAKRRGSMAAAAGRRHRRRIRPRAGIPVAGRIRTQRPFLHTGDRRGRRKCSGGLRFR